MLLLPRRMNLTSITYLYNRLIEQRYMATYPMHPRTPCIRASRAFRSESHVQHQLMTYLHLHARLDHVVVFFYNKLQIEQACRRLAICLFNAARCRVVWSTHTDRRRFVWSPSPPRCVLAGSRPPPRCALAGSRPLPCCVFSGRWPLPQLRCVLSGRRPPHCIVYAAGR